MTIDFRSDTVTKPTAGMLDAMMSAKVGDDVFEDDPTIQALESKAAAMFGKEAALFCPSGTMTNQIAIKVHTNPGDQVLCSGLSHIYNYEGGGIAFNSGCSVRFLEGDRGRITAEEVLKNINPDDPHFPVSKLVCVENTCNKGAGAIWSPDQLQSVSDAARSAGLKIHLDGARVFNALVESRESPKDIGPLFDSISICLSKGLGCPIGSLVLGDKLFIKQARRVRKVLGGGMRQVGYLGAAGIYALDNHIDRLKDDHNRANRLAGWLSQCDWVSSVDEPDTNIIVAHHEQSKDQDKLLNALSELGVLAVGFGAGKIRFVTHLDIDDAQIDEAGNLMKNLHL